MPHAEWLLNRKRLAVARVNTLESANSWNQSLFSFSTPLMHLKWIGDIQCAMEMNRQTFISPIPFNNLHWHPFLLSLGNVSSKSCQEERTIWARPVLRGLPDLCSHILFKLCSRCVCIPWSCFQSSVDTFGCFAGCGVTSQSISRENSSMVKIMSVATIENYTI